MDNLPLGYVAGDIMSRGSQLARQEECDKMDAAHLNVQYYSPALNKSINDKSNMTEEQNNCLAEKITEADIDRLWNADFTVVCPEQSAIGTLCETGCLFGWQYMSDKLLDIYDQMRDEGQDWKTICQSIMREIYRINAKHNYFHYSDIRTNHLNEKDWRRSFSINQLLYGVILATAEDGKLHNNFDEVLPLLRDMYGVKEENTNAI